MSSQPRQQQAHPQPPRQDTPEEAAARRRRWLRIAVFTAAGLVLAWNAWAYLWPELYPRLFPVTLPDEVSIESVVAEFNDDPAAAKKYENKRIVVVGKLVIDEPKDGKPARIYYQLAGQDGAQIPVDFYDIDDAGTVDPGDQVSLSGVMRRKPSGEIWLVGAGQMPTPAQ
jgi:hypothetical protein